MSIAVVLDSGPVGYLTNPRVTGVPPRIRQWLDDLIRNGRRVILPEIVDYEIRREFILGNMLNSLSALDRLGLRVEYLPITTDSMRRASIFWAQIRQGGKPTASPHQLDVDVIVAAQAVELQVPAIVATGNAIHIRRFLPADDWTAITP